MEEYKILAENLMRFITEEQKDGASLEYITDKLAYLLEKHYSIKFVKDYESIEDVILKIQGCL